MFYADFAESYENDQQDVIQSAYFGNQCFSIFTVYCYTKNPNNNDVKNDNAIVITKSFNPQWVVYKKLSTRSNTCMKNGMILFGVME